MNDWIDTIERFNTFGKYPFATLVHIGVGIFTGVRLELARLRKESSHAIQGLVVFAGWLAYEISEFARVADEVDVDIANGLGGIFIAILISWWNQRYERHLRLAKQNPEDSTQADSGREDAA